jgi:hypothetical protein
MCGDCYARLTGGDPPPDTPAVREAAALVAAVYAAPWGGTGGPLHVEIEDMNLEDRFFASDSALETAISWYGEELGDDGADLCRRTFCALAALSEAERASAVWNYLELSGGILP